MKQISIITYHAFIMVIQKSWEYKNKNNFLPKGTHCLLYNKDFSQDGEYLWRYLEKGHVKYILKVGSNLESNFVWYVTTGKGYPLYFQVSAYLVSAITSHHSAVYQLVPSTTMCQALC